MRALSFAIALVGGQLVAGYSHAQPAQHHIARFPEAPADALEPTAPESKPQTKDNSPNIDDLLFEDFGELPAKPVEPKATEPPPEPPDSPPTTMPSASPDVRVYWINCTDSARDRQSAHTSVSDARWYGWQTLMVDAGAVLAGGILSGSASKQLGLSALAGAYALGGPMVHVGHHNLLNAGASVLVRLSFPTVGGLIGSSSDTCRSDECPGLMLGVLIGMATAVAVDSAALSYETEQAPVQQSTTNFGISAMFNAAHKPMGIQLSGAF